MESKTKAILVGCEPDEAAHVREALAECAVEVEAEFPDARSAIDSVRLSPNELRLCFMSVPGPEQVQPLKWLSESFVGRPLVALVGRDSNAEFLFAVNRAGAGQILPMPLAFPDLKAALHSLKVRHSSPQSVAARRVIAVSGVTGGCGATTIAINLAYEIAYLYELSCVLVELAPMGMVATCLDVDARHTTSDLLCDMQSVDVGLVKKTLSRITDRFSILPAPFREAEPLNATAADVIRLLEYVKQLADVVILDLPANNSDRHLETFAATDQVVLVAEQAVPSLRALTYVRERLSEDEGFRRQTLVINRYSPNKEGFNVTHLQRLLRTPQLVTIASDYPAVSASHNEGRPLREQSAGSRVLADIDKLAGMLVSTGAEAPAGKQPGRKRLGRLVRSMFGL
ncbi:MAG TPA: cellulose synthase operon protein YhjQ/BcsQ [Gemmataceae bacterium]|jgi:pilus assembly protein CpaE|nr:cellulose synthase operon protein YhjQ/BcsQ [Gemmataceae bacterium]